MTQCGERKRSVGFFVLLSDLISYLKPKELEDERTRGEKRKELRNRYSPGWNNDSDDDSEWEHGRHGWDYHADYSGAYCGREQTRIET